MSDAPRDSRTGPGTPPAIRPGSGVDVATVLQLAATVDDPAALATVLEARGSVPQVRGAMLLVAGDLAVGTVGGGAAEAKTLVACRAVLAGGRSTEVEIDLAGHPGEVRDGVCGGRMRIAVDLLDAPARAVFAEAATREITAAKNKARVGHRRLFGAAKGELFNGFAPQRGRCAGRAAAR